MSQRKYLKDYKLIHTVNEKGRISSEPEYVGDYFVFQGNDDEAKAGGKKVLTLSLAAWICFFSSLLLNNGAMRLYWVSLPYVFTAIPLWKLTSAATALQKAEDRFTRRESDLFSNSFPAAAVWGMVLPIIAFAGTVLSAICGWGNLVRTDILFCACAVCCAFLCYLCFTLRKLFTTEKL